MNARYRVWLISLATIVGITATSALGRWQLQRAADKEALQAQMDARDQRQVVDGALLLSNSRSLESLIYQRAVLRGHWLGEHTVYLDNRQMNAGVGFFVLTPLVLEGSHQTIVVQRGWVPRNFLERNKLPPVQTPTDLVTVEGRIAPPPSKLMALGSADVGTIRQNLDLDQYRQQIQQPLLPVTVMQTGAASEGLLREWPAPNLGVEKHYGYALQWFAMAALMALLYLWFQIIKPRYPAKDSRPHAP